MWLIDLYNEMLFDWPFGTILFFVVAVLWGIAIMMWIILLQSLRGEQ